MVHVVGSVVSSPGHRTTIRADVMKRKSLKIIVNPDQPNHQTTVSPLFRVMPLKSNTNTKLDIDKAFDSPVAHD